jgi:type VII secretion-associated serine protease mycosin
LATAAALATVATATVVPLAPGPAAAAPLPCPVTPPAGVASVTEVPWAQQRFDLDRLAAFTGDRKVTVAVIDSGVDANHPQLRGAQVLAGRDFIDTGGDGRQDCVGHGTAVASLIAAQQATGTPFRGLAPGVSILPIRVSEQGQGTGTGRQPTNPGEAFANAIQTAVDRGAQVINLSLVLFRDEPKVREATANAVRRGVVVVAAVGNSHADGDPVPYPAAYDGVIGVGAIDPGGARFEGSQVGRYVDIVAPGTAITVASPGRGYQSLQGTSMATPFVSATAALMLQYRPQMSGREVAARLLATADPAPGGPGSNEYGWGVVNPYRALTEAVTSERPKELGPIPAYRPDPAAAEAAAAAARTRTVALWLAGGVGALAVAVLLVANLVPRGRRRGWRPGTG